MKRLMNLLRSVRGERSPTSTGNAADQHRYLPQQLFNLSLELDPANGQLVFDAAELIERQADEIRKLKQGAHQATRKEKRT